MQGDLLSFENKRSARHLTSRCAPQELANRSFYFFPLSQHMRGSCCQTHQDSELFPPQFCSTFSVYQPAELVLRLLSVCRQSRICAAPDCAWHEWTQS